jgi:hypothetical protein
VEADPPPTLTGLPVAHPTQMHALPLISSGTQLSAGIRHRIADPLGEANGEPTLDRDPRDARLFSTHGEHHPSSPRPRLRQWDADRLLELKQRELVRRPRLVVGHQGLPHQTLRIQ